MRYPRLLLAYLATVSMKSGLEDRNNLGRQKLAEYYAESQ